MLKDYYIKMKYYNFNNISYSFMKYFIIVPVLFFYISLIFYVSACTFFCTST